MFIDDSPAWRPADTAAPRMDPERRRAFQARKRALFWDASCSGRHTSGGLEVIRRQLDYDAAQADRARLEPTAAAHTAAGHDVVTAPDNWKACQTCGAADLQ